MDSSALEASLKALEASLSVLQTRLDELSYALLFCTGVVVVGLVVEYHVDFRELVTGRPRDRRKLWPVIVGGSLVVLGIAGELFFTFKSFGVESEIRTTNSKIESALRLEVGVAQDSAVNAAKASSDAESSAKQADNEAGSAERKSNAVAKQATEIAKSLEKTSDILLLLKALSQARHIPDTKPLIEKLKDLKELKGKSIIVESYAPDAWGYGLCESLYGSVHSAEMNAIDSCGKIPYPTNTPVFTGLGVWGPDQGLAEKIGETISRAGRLGTTSGVGPPGSPFIILIGVQNPFWIGQ